MKLILKGIWAVPVIVSILILGLISFNGHVFAQQTLAQGLIILSDISDNPENNFVPGQIIVGLKNDPAGVESDIKSKGGKILEENDKLNALLVKVPNKAEDAFLEAIKNNPNVTFAVKNHVVKKTAFTPNDPYWTYQWDMKIIKAHEAWSTQLGSTDVIVAVVDTGVDYNHSDLAGRVILGPDYAYGDNDPMDGDGHGTHVAGTVGATTNNGVGVAGLAQVKILAIKVLNDFGSGSDWSVSLGITYAENNADIINLSLGCGCTAGDLPLTKAALDSAYSKDVLIVAAAGNSGSSGPHYPSDDPNVISVSATTKDDTLASYSNRGNSIELSAPGGDTQGGSYWETYVLSTYKGNSYAFSVGTSMASPHVAGVAALVLSQNPNLSNVELRTHLQNTADDLGSTGLDPLYGYGRVNAQTAVTTILSPPPMPNNPPTADANGPYSGTEDLAIAFDGSGSSDPDGDALTYSWDFGDSSTGTGVTPSHTYGWGDTFTVTLTISDGSDSDSTTSTVTVTEVNDVPAANANGPYSGTVNKVITFDGSGSSDPDNLDGTTSNDQTLTYSWSFGDGGSATVVNPSHTYTTTGTFTVTLVVNDGVVDSISITTATISEPSPDVSVSSISPDTVQPGGSVDVTISGSGFVTGASVSLSGGKGPTPSVSNVVVVDGDTITATITTKTGGPPRDRSWDVTVTSPDGSSDTLVDGFTVTVTSAQHGNSKA